MSEVREKSEVCCNADLEPVPGKGPAAHTAAFWCVQIHICASEKFTVAMCCGSLGHARVLEHFGLAVFLSNLFLQFSC